MTRQEKVPINLDGSDACGLEGVGERPEDCPNNPRRYPDNYRPNVCLQCPGNSEIWKASQMPLPIKHIIYKQTKPKNPGNS